MNILFAASECVPFVKTGGLADVIGALPRALSSRLPGLPQKRKTAKSSSGRSQIAVVMPKYSLIDARKHGLRKIHNKLLIPMGDRIETGSVWSCSEKGKSKKACDLRFYFIESKKYFDRPGIYGIEGTDFEDNDERFIFFSRAVLELCKIIDFIPDIIHCHDWQTGLIPAYLRTLYNTDSFFNHSASIFSVHNIAYQGIFPKQSLFFSGLGWKDFTPDKLEYYDQLCFLKSGLVFSDKISTVSPNYAKEIRSSSDIGRGMEGILSKRSADFSGIINGIDTSYWDPGRDPYIFRRFSLKSKTSLEKKALCKKDLQSTVHLPQNPKAPLLGMVSRLDPQKGFGKIAEIFPKLFQFYPDAQCVILGVGDKKIEEVLTTLSKDYPNQLTLKCDFNERLAHKIYAGSDLFFMPSEFEPCGLGQLIAMKYGSIPIVTPTGGLLDTVVNWDPRTGRGTGFMCQEMTSESIRKTLEDAFEAFENRPQWKKLVNNAMRQNFSWDRSADQYIKLYSLTQRKAVE